MDQDALLRGAGAKNRGQPRVLLGHVDKDSVVGQAKRRCRHRASSRVLDSSLSFHTMLTANQSVFLKRSTSGSQLATTWISSSVQAVLSRIGCSTSLLVSFSKDFATLLGWGGSPSWSTPSLSNAGSASLNHRRIACASASTGMSGRNHFMASHITICSRAAGARKG